MDSAINSNVSDAMKASIGIMVQDMTQINDVGMKPGAFSPPQHFDCKAESPKISVSPNVNITVNNHLSESIKVFTGKDFGGALTVALKNVSEKMQHQILYGCSKEEKEQGIIQPMGMLPEGKELKYSSSFVGKGKVYLGDDGVSIGDMNYLHLDIKEPKDKIKCFNPKKDAYGTMSAMLTKGGVGLPPSMIICTPDGMGSYFMEKAKSDYFKNKLMTTEVKMDQIINADFGNNISASVTPEVYDDAVKSVFTFGKYEGFTISEVMNAPKKGKFYGVKYLRWMVSQPSSKNKAFKDMSDHIKVYLHANSLSLSDVDDVSEAVGLPSEVYPLVEGMGGLVAGSIMRVAKGQLTKLIEYHILAISAEEFEELDDFDDSFFVSVEKGSNSFWFLVV